MNTLVLHRGSLAANPYHRWLADHPGRIVLLASAEQLALYGEELPVDEPKYAHVEAVSGYDSLSLIHI